MKLERLDLRRMPGITDEFTLDDLSPQLNLIVGDNGTGKTTTIRAIRSLLWPDHDQLEVVDLDSRWTCGPNGTLAASQVKSGDTRWHRAGAMCEPPPLPETRFAHCFTPSLVDLLSAKSGVASLADRVLLELSGGYDLKTLMASDAFVVKGRPGQKEKQSVAKAQNEVGRLKAEHRGLFSDQMKLEHLRDELGRAKAAQDTVDRLQQAQEVFAARSNLELAEAELATFPAEMMRYQGDELERIGKLRDRLAERKSNHRQAAEQVQILECKRVGLSLPEVPPAADLEAAGSALGRVGEERVRLQQAQKELANARGRVTEEAIALTGVAEVAVTIDDPEQLLRDLESFLTDAGAVKERRIAIDERLESLGPSSPVADEASLHEAVGALRYWLRSPAKTNASADVQSALRLAVAVLSGSLALLGVILLVGSNLLGIAGLLAAGFGLWAWSRREAVQSSSAKVDAEERFQRTGIQGPTGWTAEAVSSRLAELEQAQASAAQGRERERTRQDLLLRRQSWQAENDAVEQKRRSLQQRTGLAVSDLGLAVLARGIIRYHEAKAQAEASSAEIHRLDRAIEDDLNAVRAILQKYGIDDTATADLVIAQLDQLAQRATDARKTETELTHARDGEWRTGNDVTETEAEISTFFESVGLQSGDELTLRKRVGSVVGYATAKKACEKAGSVLQHVRAALGEAADLEELSCEQIDQILEQARAKAAMAEGLAKAITEIETKVASARSHTTLQDALAELESARDALAAVRDDRLRRVAANFLLDDVDQAHRRESRPPVLERAATWFGQFTHGRYELSVGRSGTKDETAFYAIETDTKRELGLDQLSDGTRAQLLLAVRLAFAVEMERGEKLPILLDEALSVSDPARFEAVVESLLTLVKENDRQIFYMTSQPVDAERWQAHTNGTALKIIRLEEVRSMAAAASPAALAPPKVEVIPAPDGHTSAEYASLLRVPAFDPWQPAEAQHLYYLLDDDLVTLHALLQARIQRLGPLKAMLASGANGLVPDETRRLIEVRGQIIEAFLEVWRQGRGRPLTREVLVQGGVTAKFVDKVSELASDMGWNAAEVLTGLRAKLVAGFRTAAIESLEDYCLEHGYLDTRPVLTPDEIPGRVIGAVGSLVGGQEGSTEIAARCDHLCGWTGS